MKQMKDHLQHILKMMQRYYLYANYLGYYTDADLLYGGVGNNKSYGDDGDDTLIGGTGADRDIISDYDNETNSVELIDELKESDLTCSYIGVDKQIKYENDLMAIIQNTIAEDFTFIQVLLFFRLEIEVELEIDYF